MNASSRVQWRERRAQMMTRARQSAGWFGSSVWPAATARAALMLFSKPRRRQRPAQENKLLASARRFEIGGRLAAWSWGSGPTVLLVHGWEGRGAQLGSLVDPLVTEGFEVVTFDAPAHGDSPGSFATIASFRDAISAAARDAGPLHAVVAHSLGAPAAALALQAGVRTDCAVFLAAPASLDTAFAEFGRRLQLSERALREFKTHASRLTGVDLENLRAPMLAPSLPPPLLIIHDRSDAAVPCADGQQLADHWQDSTLWLTESLGHQRILRDPDVAKRVAAFIASVPVERHCSELERRFSLSPLAYT
jgi:pimeloyl-ACP methyl ester carboxylesterase